MLKRLELVGFKSFADKTVFEFADGVTGIIGPNGSGKSNVVDAVRWVLGEQSAKSLRGGEMTDVIFNGSASRRSLGMAEVVMVFDNHRKSLATDAEEVRIGRRVYRSGECEYLINNQPCRLKDIKDLFLGSGAGTDAYCIIQQGQVDVLLQTSPKDRRTIFEEAAGISRAKAKKVESLRTLARAQADAERVRDILDEVEKQLRSVRLQAAKAERYQEYTARLKELRIGLSLREYHKNEIRLADESGTLERLRATVEQSNSRADSHERELAEIEEQLVALDGVIRQQETQRAEALQLIAAETARRRAAWSSLESTLSELEQSRVRGLAATRALFELDGLLQKAERERIEAEEQFLAQGAKTKRLDADFAATEKNLTQLRDESEELKDQHVEFMREASQLNNETATLKGQLDASRRECERIRLRSNQAAEHLASLDVELEELQRADEAIGQRLGASREARDSLRADRERVIELREDTVRRLADLRAERSGLQSRIEVLENLERSHEGLSTGVREVLEHLTATEPGLWTSIAGIVAELLAVRREYAPLIDLALGDRAQRFVVLDPDRLNLALLQRGKPFSGRVSFLLYTPTKPEPRKSTSALTTGKSLRGEVRHPGVLALAENVVRCEDPRFPDLPSLLLPKTLIVRDLVAARAMHALGAGYRCITQAGELLEVDGTLTLGTHHAEAGILSRKSELRELRTLIRQVDVRLTEFDRDLEALRAKLTHLDSLIDHAESEMQVLSEQATDMRWRISKHNDRRAGLSEEVSVSQSELETLEQDIERYDATWKRTVDRADAAETAVSTARNRLTQISAEIRDLETIRITRQQESLDARVALAQVEERLASSRQRQQQLQADRQQRHHSAEQLADRIADLTSRCDETQLQLLNGSAALAMEYARKETADRILTQTSGERSGIRRRKQELGEQVQSGRSNWRSQQESLRTLELSVNNLQHVRTSLIARLQEDYQIDLANLYREMLNDSLALFEQPLPINSDGLNPEDEITELRRKLSKLGAVNLEAIEELAQLDLRYTAQKTQYDDLIATRDHLMDIIERINVDSRKLFKETFDTIRAHFQELFRKLFGGGNADVTIEEGGDILEAGIEIVARPPGKELRSISLMSGGEKTMTAVALLMAIFRSKPSPFCILDEVDAALDEANVGRFTAVLREFLDRSQFIIITHHKRTMSAADVLYGVTMQESGVSSRFSVRFEDWPDEEKAA